MVALWIFWPNLPLHLVEDLFAGITNDLVLEPFGLGLRLGELFLCHGRSFHILGVNVNFTVGPVLYGLRGAGAPYFREAEATLLSPC